MATLKDAAAALEALREAVDNALKFFPEGEVRREVEREMNRKR